MGETSHATTTSRLGQLNSAAAAGGGGGGGEIVEVQGGHIVRSTGRKDRHSKVCTAKGPRDRRVRLAAHTAIQFYDVQDRLGYDRPSKAVDWLIENAKSAIDELAQLPAWHPTNYHQQIAVEQNDNDNDNDNDDNNNNSNNFLPPSLDSDAIADTIKSFFPMGASNDVTEFHNFPPPPDLRQQDLRLSLQSFQDSPIMQHHQNQTHLGFDAAWHSQGDQSHLYHSAQNQNQNQNQNQFIISQRGPLQSSNTPSVRAWIDPIDNHPSFLPIYPSGGFSGFHIPTRIQGDQDEEHDGYSDKPSSASSDSRH